MWPIYNQPFQENPEGEERLVNAQRNVQIYEHFSFTFFPNFSPWLLSYKEKLLALLRTGGLMSSMVNVGGFWN